MSEPSVGGRFQLWENNADPYNHVELYTNWNTLDALIGGTAQGGNNPWPPQGQTIKSMIESVGSNSMPLGTILPWWRPPATASGAVSTPVPSGFEICDGRTITNAGFVDSNGVVITSVILPDLRNRFLVGAVNDPTKDGVVVAAASQSNTAAGAPGMLKPTAASPTYAASGEAGGNTQIPVSLNVPNHYHDHDHVHEVGPVTNGGGYETSDPSVGQAFVPSSPNQQGVVGTHKHSIDLFSSSPRRPDDANLKVSGSGVSGASNTIRRGTTLQKAPTGDTSRTGSPFNEHAGTELTGGTPGDVLNISGNYDARPLHVGVLYIMKVRVS